ncbi:MAG: class I SAM-dependent methyltransferase [Chitinophagales bacterium]
MPYSVNVFDGAIREIVIAANPKIVLDIGCGAGKYGKLIKSLMRDIFCIGVEIDKAYIKEFDLESVYDRLICTNIATLMGNVDDHFDIVIFGNVLEHLPKSLGIDLLNFFVYRAKLIIINYPFGELQDSYKGHKHEAHISVWSMEDFKQFNFLEFSHGMQRLAIISGFENSILPLLMVKEICLKEVEGLTFNNQ